MVHTENVEDFRCVVLMLLANHFLLSMHQSGLCFSNTLKSSSTHDSYNVILSKDH